MAKKNYNPKPFPLSFLDDEQIKNLYEILKKEGKVRFDGVGDFSLRNIEGRTGWNPVKKELMEVPAYTKIHFRPAPKFYKFFN